MATRRTVWKYALPRHGGGMALQIPKGGRVLHFAPQASALCIWVEVDPSEPVESRTFDVVGTGFDVMADAQYVQTCFDGPFVWHLYEYDAEVSDA